MQLDPEKSYAALITMPHSKCTKKKFSLKEAHTCDRISKNFGRSIQGTLKSYFFSGVGKKLDSKLKRTIRDSKMQMIPTIKGDIHRSRVDLNDKMTVEMMVKGKSTYVDVVKAIISLIIHKDRGEIVTFPEQRPPMVIPPMVNAFPEQRPPMVIPPMVIPAFLDVHSYSPDDTREDFAYGEIASLVQILKKYDVSADDISPAEKLLENPRSIHHDEMVEIVTKSTVKFTKLTENDRMRTIDRKKIMKAISGLEKALYGRSDLVIFYINDHSKMVADRIKQSLIELVEKGMKNREYLSGEVYEIKVSVVKASEKNYLLGTIHAKSTLLESDYLALQIEVNEKQYGRVSHIFGLYRVLIELQISAVVYYRNIILRHLQQFKQEERPVLSREKWMALLAHDQISDFVHELQNLMGSR